MNTDHLLIWKVAHPPDPTPAPKGKIRMGRPIAARLSKVQAEEMRDTLRKDGVDVVVYRA